MPQGMHLALYERDSTYWHPRSKFEYCRYMNFEKANVIEPFEKRAFHLVAYQFKEPPPNNLLRFQQYFLSVRRIGHHFVGKHFTMFD